MTEQLTPLQQVQADAKRLTLKRIEDEKASKAWQEAQQGTVTLEDKPEVVVVEVPKVKTTRTKKGK